LRLSHQILFAMSITLAAIIVPRLVNAAEHVVEMRNQDDEGNRMAKKRLDADMLKVVQ
jgi:hypothetical protein